MLLALQHPTEGEARILGLDAAAASVEVHRRTGYRRTGYLPTTPS